jgi:hypothetical protein
MKTIQSRLQEMTNKLNSENFQKSLGLGNEVDFHIFDYDPQDEYTVRDYIYNYLIPKSNLKLKVFDIYDLIIEILEEQHILDAIFNTEKRKGSKYVNEQISSAIGIGTSKNYLSRKIKEKVELGDIVILIGIDKCYGIVRGHTILNNLQGVITNNQLIMMYPGSYDKQSFRLFNKLPNDDYYRGFQLVDRK